MRHLLAALIAALALAIVPVAGAYELDPCPSGCIPLCTNPITTAPCYFGW